jgi:hypothetical protein
MAAASERTTRAPPVGSGEAYGAVRVSKADGSQTLDLQRDALLAAGVEPGHLYEDQASGKRDNRPTIFADV